MKLYSILYRDWSPLNVFYPQAECVVLTENSQLKEPGIVISWGGGDIHPSLYGRDNQASHVGARPSDRDLIEQRFLIEAVEKKFPIFGVCRGAQLACALAGGILIQNVQKHGWTHQITTNDGRTMLTSSLHHQMMYPWAVPHELLAWSAESLSSVYHGITEQELDKIPLKDGDICEPEVVWFPTIKALAIQGHPEMMSPHCTFNRYVRELVTTYLSV